MSNVLKYLGVLILLIGVGLLAIQAFAHTGSNQILVIGLSVVVLGFLVHLVIGRRLE